MTDVTFRWTETDRARPAHDVLVRLTALTANAYEDGDLGDYLMAPAGDGIWVRTLNLPDDLRTAYQLCPVRDRPVRDAYPEQERWLEILATGEPDPDQADALPPGLTWGNPGAASVLALRNAPPQPWVEPRPDVSAGELTRVQLGDSIVHIWTPPGPPVPDLPVAIAFDGASLVRIGITTTFANLVAFDAVPPFVAVLVESIHGSAERGPTRIRSLTHPDEFVTFTLEELLPHLEHVYGVTRDPRRTVVAGQSLGGLAAAHLATVAPGRIGQVIGQSAALWWPGDEDGGLSGASVISSYAAEVPSRTRLFLEVGTEERELLDANRRFRDVLERRGYDVRYREYRGGHDYSCWRGGLADALITTLN